MSDIDKPSSEIHEALHDRTLGLERELIDLQQRHAKLVEAARDYRAIYDELAEALLDAIDNKNDAAFDGFSERMLAARTRLFSLIEGEVSDG